MNIRKLKKYQYVSVECSKLVSEGMGLSHLLPNQFDYEVKPQTGFILGILPGEKGVIEVRKVIGKCFHGVLVQQGKAHNPTDPTWSNYSHQKFAHEKWCLYNVSESREQDKCDNFVVCGGCSLLHVDYFQTLQYKMGWFKEHLDYNQIAYPSIQLLGSPKTTQYRNNVQIHINKLKQQGFYSPMTYRTVPFPEHGCLLFNQNLSDKHFPAKWSLERCIRTRLDEPSCTVSHWPLNSVEDKKGQFTYNLSLAEEKNIKIHLPNSAFFQVNSTFIPVWFNIIQKWAKRCQQATNSDTPKVLELFCGFGFISKLLHLFTPIQFMGMDIISKQVFEQVRMECNSILLDATLFNQNYFSHNIHELDRCPVDILHTLQNYYPDILIINPPRSGITPEGLRFLLDVILRDVRVPVIYSSCNASTFARDMKVFHDRGYQIKELYLLDFFPWTPHYETLAFIT